MYCREEKTDSETINSRLGRHMTHIILPPGPTENGRLYLLQQSRKRIARLMNSPSCP